MMLQDLLIWYHQLWIEHDQQPLEKPWILTLTNQHVEVSSLAQMQRRSKTNCFYSKKEIENTNLLDSKARIQGRDEFFNEKGL